MYVGCSSPPTGCGDYIVAPTAFERTVQVFPRSRTMFSSTTFLIAFSVIAACSAKPIQLPEYKCAYSSDISLQGSDLSKCQSCVGYSKVAALQTDVWFEPIYLFCYESSPSEETQEAKVRMAKTVS